SRARSNMAAMTAREPRMRVGGVMMSKNSGVGDLRTLISAWAAWRAEGDFRPYLQRQLLVVRKSFISVKNNTSVEISSRMPQQPRSLNFRGVDISHEEGSRTTNGTTATAEQPRAIAMHP